MSPARSPAQGTLDVNIAQTGTLTVQNVGSTLTTRNFTVAGGTPSSAGTVNITVSEGARLDRGDFGATHAVTFNRGANLGVQYGSFIPTGGTFTLISAPTGQLNIAAADIGRYSAQIGSNTTLPFLFNSATIQRVNNVGGQDILQLSVAAKTQAQLGLTGYAAKMFPLAQAAIAGDDALGSALIAGINSQAQAQAAYDAFAPDVSGGARAVAISLTDQATGVVAARQRQLRLFAKSPGELTLWGNEFGEYISTKGGTVTSALNPGAVNGFKDHGFGFSLGLDGGAPDTGWYGAAFTFYTGDIAEGGDRLSKTSTLWYMLTGYTDWRGRGLFVDSQITVGYGNFKGKRFPQSDPSHPRPQPGTFAREADSKRAGLVGAFGPDDRARC